MSNQREELLSDLKRIKSNNFEINKEDALEYIEVMLQYIGDTDSEFRDMLIYGTLRRWICIKEYVTDDELVKILTKVLDDDHLFYHMGDDGNETVFTRTFSVLVIALVLSMHRKKHFLDEDCYKKIKKALVRYYKEEKDLRGYINNMGWAHGAAHCADAFCELVKCKEANRTTCEEVLDAIKSVLHNEYHMFSNEEDERIVCILFIIILKKMLPSNTIINWLDEVCNFDKYKNERSKFIAHVNTKNFVRCLYFRLLDESNVTNITYNLLEREKKLNSFKNDSEILA